MPNYEFLSFSIFIFKKGKKKKRKSFRSLANATQIAKEEHGKKERSC